MFQKISFGFIALVLKLLKSAKFLKVAMAGGSMAAYSYLFTWQFAIILLFAIIVHEYGHLLAMKKVGIPTKGIYLIPFFGGAAVASEAIRDYNKESIVSLAGPMFGILSLIPFLILYVLTNEALYIGLISFISLINLFNLLPINPLDGGRVVKSIAFSIGSKFGLFIYFLMFSLMIFLVFTMKYYLLLFIFILGSIELLGEVYLKHKNSLYEDYVMINKKDMFNYTFIYIGLISVFVYIIYLCGQVEGADLALKMLKDH